MNYITANYSYIVSVKLKMRKFGTMFQVEIFNLSVWGFFFFLPIQTISKTCNIFCTRVTYLSNNLLFAESNWFLNKLLLLDSFHRSLVKTSTSLASGTTFSWHSPSLLVICLQQLRKVPFHSHPPYMVIFPALCSCLTITSLILVISCVAMHSPTRCTVWSSRIFEI